MAEEKKENNDLSLDKLSNHEEEEIEEEIKPIPEILDEVDINFEKIINNENKEKNGEKKENNSLKEVLNIDNNQECFTKDNLISNDEMNKKDINDTNNYNKDENKSQPMKNNFFLTNLASKVK